VAAHLANEDVAAGEVGEEEQAEGSFGAFLHDGERGAAHALEERDGHEQEEQRGEDLLAEQRVAGRGEVQHAPEEDHGHEPDHRRGGAEQVGEARAGPDEKFALEDGEDQLARKVPAKGFARKRGIRGAVRAGSTRLSPAPMNRRAWGAG
jgi:hypothetical protein